MTKDLHLVGFRVGRETYGVPIATVREIVRVPEITAVPNAPDHVQGVINLRGKIVPVIDLRRRLGQQEITKSRTNRILVVDLADKIVGLIVHSASEVLKIPAADMEPPDSLLHENENNCVVGVGKLHGRLILLLDLNKVLQRGELNGLNALEEQAVTQA
jgi:purine-binding chemotaxis protein CheW